MRLNEELSYKEICLEMQDKEVQGGDHRKRQLVRWNQVAEVQKVGRGKYIITRQLSPDEIQEGQYTRNYSKFLQNMLVNMFAKEENTVQTYTYRQLREYLNMVNRRYFPVKYGNDSVDIDAPRRVNIGNILEDDEAFRQFMANDDLNHERDSALVAQEKFWFLQADNHDKDALHYALRVLRNRGLLVSFNYTYVFYKVIKNDDGVIVCNQPTIATDEQRAEIHQRIMDFLKEKLPEERRKAIEERVDAENAEDKEGRILGLYRKAVLGSSEELRREYTDIPRKYATEIGQDFYAKAITIVRPTRLETLVDTFAPKFNGVQVEEYLRSKKFKKDELPESVHIQLTNQLIKI